MKRVFCLALALLMVLPLCACKKKKQPKEYTRSQITETDAIEQYDEQMTELNQLINQTFTNTVDSTEQSIFDKDGIKVVYLGMSSDETEGLAIHLHLENTLNEALDVTAKNFAINGISLNETFDCSVYGNHSTDYSIIVTKKMLKDGAISTVKNIAFSLVFTDGTSNVVVDTKKMNIDIPSGAGAAQPIDRSGVRAYSSDGFNVYLRRVNSVPANESFWGGKVMLTVDNTTSSDVTITLTSIMLNNNATDATFDFELGAGQTLVRELVFTQQQMVDCKAGTVDLLQFMFAAYDGEDKPLTNGASELAKLY